MADQYPPRGGSVGRVSGRRHTRHISISTTGDQSSASEDFYPSAAQSRSEPITRRPSNAQIWVPVHPIPSESTPVSPTDAQAKPAQGLPNQAAAAASLYSPPTTALSSPGGQRLSQSPFLHHTHRQPVKETHLLDVDFDPISGRKSVNSYEIINEIGRGVHGKVKLGRNLENNEFVAIKIVERNSRPRLGKPGQKKGSQEEKVKGEIAILKKCRHDNVVRLIEVIDDPACKKVYLVLEFVELGEVKWRRPGDENIAQKEALRLEKLRALALGLPDARQEEQRRERQLRRRIVKQNEAARKARDNRKRQQEQNADSDRNWSLELGGETDDSITDDENALEESSDESQDDETPTAIQESADMNPFTQGLFEIPRNYSLSTIATSTSDSYDQDLMFIPALTMQQARQVFRDTVLGLEYLHYQGIIHRDIKPANLLWNREHRVKISDFGVSYVGQGMDEDGNMELDQTDIELAKTVGTPAFFAPELCYTDLSKPRPQITEAIDIWALGVTLYCLLFAHCPFLASGEYELYHVIETQELFIPNTRLRPSAESPAGSRPSTRRSHAHKKNPNFRLSGVLEDQPSNTHESISVELKDLLQRLLEKNPAQRITLPEVKRHPWVLQDLDDPISWIEETDPRQARPVQISREDVDHAVISATVLNRVRNSIRKAVGGIAGAVGLRRRAHSAVVIPTTTSEHTSFDGTSDEHEAIGNHDTEAQKALRREKNLAPPQQPHSSPLRRATSVSAANKDSKTSLVTGLLPATGSKAPPPTPIAETAVPQYELAEAQHSRRGQPSSQFSSRLAIGRLLRASKSRDMHRDFRDNEHSSEPGDSDVAWKPAPEKERKTEQRDKQQYGSVRGLSGMIRRGSRQSCDSIMRLTAGFADNRSSRSASPMPSMPSSPAEEPKAVFPPQTPSKSSPVSPISDTEDMSKKLRRGLSPLKAKSPELDSIGNCPPSPDDITYLDVLASRSNREGVFSGDDSSFSNTTTKVPASHGGLRWDPSFSSPRSRAIDMDREISPGTSVKSPTMSPQTRSPGYMRSFRSPTQIVSGAQDRQALTSSSSEDHLCNSSLSNSTSFPSVLSVSSSLSTDDQWSLSPNMRLGSADRLNALSSPALRARGTVPLDIVEDVEGTTADIEDADDDDDEDDDEGFFLDLSRKKKDVRSNSMATSSRPQLNQEQIMNRRKSIVP